MHGTPYMLTLEEFELIRRNTRSLSAVTVSQWSFLTLDDAERSDFRGKYVSCNHLTTHVRPMLLGRGFAESDCAPPGAQPVIVLTGRGWTLRFGRDPPSVLAGLLVGMPLAALSANLLQRNNLRVGIEPLDPWIFGGAIILVAMAAGVATLIPALRVTRIDPSRILNSN